MPAVHDPQWEARGINKRGLDVYGCSVCGKEIALAPDMVPPRAKHAGLWTDGTARHTIAGLPTKIGG